MPTGFRWFYFGETIIKGICLEHSKFTHDYKCLLCHYKSLRFLKTSIGYNLLKQVYG